MPEPKAEILSYAQARKVTVELRVQGDDGLSILAHLGVAAKDIKVLDPVDGPRTFVAKVKPFAHLSKVAYAKWVAEMLRKRISETWWHRW